MTRWLTGLAVVLGLMTTAAQAGLFKNSEQEAFDRLRAGDYVAAADTFQDPYRRGVALYRAGRYEEAARAFEHADHGSNAEAARYNLGNSRFQLGDFAGAVAAYEQVLSADPTQEDAAYNLSLA
ncbi:MAG: tetratricopeptide repeat protein, partial [Chromatiaceae bacterium]